MLKITKHFLLVGAALVALAAVTPAQFTITIPKIPKIKKDKPVVTPTTDSVPTNTSSDTSSTTTSSDSSDTESSDDSGGAGWWINYHVDEIAKLKKQFDEWDPENEYFPASITNDDYTGLALSKKERATWLKDHKQGPNAKLDAAFDSLRASVLKRMPEHKIEPKTFAFHSVAEEKMLVRELSDIVGLKVFKTGFSEGSWLIEKNDYGLPTARYKHGAVYGRNPNAEDQLCRVWYVNIVQDYSGGGTYGASGTRFVGKSYYPCPAGQ